MCRLDRGRLVLGIWLEHVDGRDDLAEFIHYQKLRKPELAVGTWLKGAVFGRICRDRNQTCKPRVWTSEVQLGSNFRGP